MKESSKTNEHPINSLTWCMRMGCTCFDGGLQLAQAGGDLSVHLALARRVLWEGVAVRAERLADLRMPGVNYRQYA